MTETVLDHLLSALRGAANVSRAYQERHGTAERVTMPTGSVPSPAVRDKLLRLLRSVADGNLVGTIGELRVAAVLDGIGIEALHDVYLPDGRDGHRWTHIDHLVLTAAGILVVETKN